MKSIFQIVSLGSGLDASLTEGGNNLSSGERQLLCMTRAVVKKVNVLLLDEATSSLFVNQSINQ